jgi:hypothetical protein
MIIDCSSYKKEDESATTESGSLSQKEKRKCKRKIIFLLQSLKRPSSKGFHSSFFFTKLVGRIVLLFVEIYLYTSI